MVRSTQLIIFSVVLMALVHFSYAEKRKCKGGPNDELTQCGSHCPPTCEEPKPKPCILSCKPNVCQCKSGFVRRKDGRCVKEKECSKKRDDSDGEGGKKCPGKHESWNICGSLCAPTCANRNPPCPRIACSSRTAGCRCDEGYVRAADKSCVLPNNCPQ